MASIEFNAILSFLCNVATNSGVFVSPVNEELFAREARPRLLGKTLEFASIFLNLEDTTEANTMWVKGNNDLN